MSADPERIGRFRVDGVLGRGAMGIIYRAHDPEIDRPVAVKLIRADLLDGKDRADFLARFRREAQAAGRCTHANIVTIYDFATHEGNPFLAMELLDGINLGEARERGALPEPAQAVSVILQVLAALGAMHALGVIHRDIKPANILLVGGVVVKVTDFGISRVGGSEVTQAGSTIGTPSYMSPEQCRGEPVDARSDLFSTGAVLFEMLSGARPFAGCGYHEVMHKLLTEAPPDLRALNPSISSSLKAVVDRALEKRPDDRFPDAAAMTAALLATTDERSPVVADTGLDWTVIAAPRDGPASRTPTGTGRVSTTGTWDRDAFGALERDLARFVGPIARRLVQTALGADLAPEAFCERLAASIERAEDRTAFLATARKHLRQSATASGQVAALSILEDEQERARLALAHHLGPMARLLVKRASVAATSSDDFWDRLGKHIERDADRATFLARRGR